MQPSHSQQLFNRALQRIPGGVNSPVRAFGQVGGTPKFIARASGPWLFDVDGNRLIDCIGSWGPAILGHAHPQVLEQITSQLADGLSYGAPCEREVAMAELLCKLIPWLEQVRMVNSGTEATMSAIRLARGVTGRSRIIKFAGCYHGHADCLLVDAGSAALAFGNPSSAGVPSATAADTLVLPYNDPAALEQAFAGLGDELAAVIVEPVAGNMNMVCGDADWLNAMRRLCSRHGVLLIFDEVMSGFRVALGGASQVYDLVPDLVCYGKVIGGGFPVGAFGGRAELMAALAPLGPVYQAGTLSGNPVAMTAGLATLGQLEAMPNAYSQLETGLKQLLTAWQASAQAADVPLCWTAMGGMFGVFFSSRLPGNLHQVQQCDGDAFRRFFHAMLKQGVYLAPSMFEAGFLSLAHNQQILDTMIAAADRVFSEWQA